jgi:hypothetical protein
MYIKVINLLKKNTTCINYTIQHSFMSASVCRFTLISLLLPGQWIVLQCSSEGDNIVQQSLWTDLQSVPRLSLNGGKDTCVTEQNADGVNLIELVTLLYRDMAVWIHKCSTFLCILVGVGLPRMVICDPILNSVLSLVGTATYCRIGLGRPWIYVLCCRRYNRGICMVLIVASPPGLYVRICFAIVFRLQWVSVRVTLYSFPPSLPISMCGMASDSFVH